MSTDQPLFVTDELADLVRRRAEEGDGWAQFYLDRITSPRDTLTQDSLDRVNQALRSQR